jgi:cell division septum initiation protein DivIVA
MGYISTYEEGRIAEMLENISRSVEKLKVDNKKLRAENKELNETVDTLWDSLNEAALVEPDESEYLTL